MIRLLELGLLVAPFTVYVLWQLGARRGFPGPSRQTLLTLMAGLVLMAASLVWTSMRERHPASSHYVPAQFEDGRIVPGHGT